MSAAYELFVANGVNRVGIEAILSESGCAKASLYGHFAGKADLAIAFLEGGVGPAWRGQAPPARRR